MLDRWEHVQEGEGQTVVVTGEAGVGKSRLVQALRERLAEEAHTWLDCRCSPYARNSPLYPVIELVVQGHATGGAFEQGTEHRFAFSQRGGAFAHTLFEFGVESLVAIGCLFELLLQIGNLGFQLGQFIHGALRLTCRS